MYVPHDFTPLSEIPVETIQLSFWGWQEFLTLIDKPCFIHSPIGCKLNLRNLRLFPAQQTLSTWPYNTPLIT